MAITGMMIMIITIGGGIIKHENVYKKSQRKLAFFYVQG